MAIAIIVVAALLIVAIGLYAVGHAVDRTDGMPDQIVVDMHEAIEFCADALPSHVTAELTYDELRRLLRLHLEWIQAYHWAPDADGSAGETGPIVFEQYDALPYVMERSDVTNVEVSEETAAAVIQAHSDYLQVAGAIHLEDPVQVEQDLAELPLLDSPTESPPAIEGSASDTSSGRKPAPDEPASGRKPAPDEPGDGNES